MLVLCVLLVLPRSSPLVSHKQVVVEPEGHPRRLGNSADTHEPAALAMLCVLFFKHSSVSAVSDLAFDYLTNI